MMNGKELKNDENFNSDEKLKLFLLTNLNEFIINGKSLLEQEY